MARLFACVALLLSAAILVPASGQEKKDDKKDPAKAVKDKDKKAKEPTKGDDDEPKKDAKGKKTEKAKEPEEKIVYGQVFKGKLKSMDANSAREFTVEISMLDQKKVL